MFEIIDADEIRERLGLPSDATGEQVQAAELRNEAIKLGLFNDPSFSMRQGKVKQAIADCKRSFCGSSTARKLAEALGVNVLSNKSAPRL